MATVITNRATLSYNSAGNSETTASNIATTILQGTVTLSKTSLSTTYARDRQLTYMLSLKNESGSAVNGITVEDNLATFTVSPGVTATPLTYLGPAQLFINGVLQGEITPVVADDSITFTVTTLPANATAQILYLVEVNDYAPLTSGSEITNTAVAYGETICEPSTDSVTLTVEDFADVSVLKAMSPNPVFCGGTLTYTFEVYNYGNTAATDIQLVDTFDPAPTNITVTVDGTAIAPANFTYVAGTLTLPTGSGLSIDVPPATFTTDPTTGLVTVTPGNVTIVVTGTI